MKKFKATWFFGALVLALAVYVFWDFTEQKRKGDLSEGEVMLNEFDSSDVKEVEISKAQSSVKFKFNEDQCHILEPVKDLCDASTVENLLNTLSPLKGRKILSGSEATTKGTEFGLANEKSTRISWTLNNGQSVKMEIGSENTFDGGYYILKEDILYVVDQRVGQLTNKGLNELRSKKLWRGPEEISAFSTKDFQFSQQDGQWAMVPSAKPYGVTEEKVRIWIEDIKSLTGTKVVDEKPKSLPEKPVMTASFNKGSYSIDIFQLKDTFYGKGNSTSRYIEIPFERIEKINVSPSYFYNGKTPFQFDLERVTQLVIIEKGEKLAFEKEDQKWLYKGDKKDFKESQLPTFFQALKNLEAETFESPGNRSFSKQNRILMIDSKGSTVFEMTLGDKFKSSSRLVKVAGYDHIFSVSQISLDQLFAINFFTPKETEEIKDAHDHNH